MLAKVEQIISSGDDLALWKELDASPEDLEKRAKVLDEFLQKIRSERPKVKPRRRAKAHVPVFATGDCLSFKMKNGNFGGAVVLGVDTDPRTGSNLVATTRLNQQTKPALADFENAEVLIRDTGDLHDKPEIVWCMPLFQKKYAAIYERVGQITVEKVYDARNYSGEGYLFKPSWTSGWHMNIVAEGQFAAEENKPRPVKRITIRELSREQRPSIWKSLTMMFGRG